MNLTDKIAPSVRVIHGMFARGQLYNGVALAAFVRGLRTDDLFAGAQQQDIVAVIDCEVFAGALPAQDTPKRLDKMTIGARTYTVEEWRGAPNDGAPVFFKVLLRGGDQ